MSWMQPAYLLEIIRLTTEHLQPPPTMRGLTDWWNNYQTRRRAVYRANLRKALERGRR